MPLGIEYIQETTVFREYGPLAGNTVRLAYEYAPPIGNMISRQTAEVDARYYKRLASNGVLAFRARGFKSWGDFPGYLYFGGNSELRGYDYLEFLGNKAFFTNAELRFPIIEAALTPLWRLRRPARRLLRQPRRRRLRRREPEIHGLDQRPGRVHARCSASSRIPTSCRASFARSSDRPVIIPGFKLIDGRASYGVGLETFALGFPIHFDWSWRTMFNQDYEDAVFLFQGLLEEQDAAATGSASRVSRCGSATTSRPRSIARLEPCRRAREEVPGPGGAACRLSSSSSCRQPSTPRSNGTSRRARAASHRCKSYQSTVSLLRTIKDDELPPELRCTLKSFLDRNCRN